MFSVIQTTTPFSNQKVTISSLTNNIVTHLKWDLPTSSSRNDCIEQVPIYRPIVVGNVDYFIQHYIFPFQFAFGVFGNIFNLLVLFRERFKNHVKFTFNTKFFIQNTKLF